MENELITKDNEQMASFLKALDRMFDKLESILGNYRHVLKGERYPIKN